MNLKKQLPLRNWKCYLLFDQYFLWLPSNWTARDPGIFKRHEMLLILLNGEIKKGLCPGSLFFMGLVVTFTLEGKMGTIATFSNCFYLKRLPKWSGGTRDPLVRNADQLVGKFEMGACHWQSTGKQGLACSRQSCWLPSQLQAKGRVTSTRVRGFQCLSRTGNRREVGYFDKEMQRLWQDTAATCCVILLLNIQTQARSNAAASLKLMFSHWICLLGLEKDELLCKF